MPPAKVLASAPPPFHSIVFLAFFGGVSLLLLPSTQSLDRVASVGTFTSAVFGADDAGSTPPKSQLYAIAGTRLIFAAIVLGVTARRVLGPGKFSSPSYRPGSKLRSMKLPLVGWKSLTPFTLWSWVLLGVHFALSGTIPLLVVMGRDVQPWHLRLALVTFEVSAPCAFLVSTIVRYVLWPHTYRAKGSEGTTVFRDFDGIVTHNANVVFVIAEVALVGGVPVETGHVAFAPLWGVLYILFAWWMAPRWDPSHPKRYGAQYMYFFFDTTLPGYAPTISMAALLLVLLVFHALFSMVDEALVHASGGFVTHFVGALVAASLVCRFKD
mgnify:CR=1 FL=1